MIANPDPSGARYLPALAAIRDKDDYHTQGVVGWRSEYHAMRLALDAMLALHVVATVCSSPHYNVAGTVCPDCLAVCSHDVQEWPCETFRTIRHHLDIAREHAWLDGTPCSLVAPHYGPHRAWNGYQWNDDGSPVVGGAK